MKHTSIYAKYLVCYLNTANSVTVLVEHDLWTEALDDIQSRDFKHSSLENSPLYIIEAIRVEINNE